MDQSKIEEVQGTIRRLEEDLERAKRELKRVTEPPRAMREENEDRVRKIAGEISDTFHWTDTIEGHDYWYVVYNALRRIASEGR